MVHTRVTRNNIVDKCGSTTTYALHCSWARPGLRQRGALRTVVTASNVQRPLNGTQLTEQESLPRVHANGDAQRRPVGPGGVASVTATPNAELLAQCLFAALNDRDVSGVLSLMADDVTYENLSTSTVLRGRAAVGRFYLEALAALPEDAVFVLAGPDTRRSSGGKESFACPILQAGVAWHVELNGLVVPLSRGVGVYWADSRTGRLSRIWDNPEHTVKQSTPSLTSAAWASPLLRDLGPLVMPAALSINSFLENVIPGGIGGLGRKSAETGVNGLSAATDRDATGGGGAMGPVDGVFGLAGSVVSTLSGLIPFQALGPTTTDLAAPTGRGAGVNSSGVRVTGGIGSRIQPNQPVNNGGGEVATDAARAAAIQGATGFKEAIRMRPLPDPAWLAPQPASPSASVASSLASVDEDATFIALGSRGTTVPARSGDPTAATAASATAMSSNSEAAVAAFNGSRPSSSSIRSDISRTTNGNGSNSSGGYGSRRIVFGTADSDSGYVAAVVSGESLLPFTRSTSLNANLTGLWEKDSAASQVEAYELLLDVLELGGLQKVTARLIDGLDLRHDEQRFEISFVTVVPFFRVTEKIRFDATTTMMRRDLRSGRQSAQATRIPGGVVVDMVWEAPLAGSLKEEYLASEDGNAMAVTSTIRIGPRTASATQVYRRTNRNKSDFLASKRSVYGSLEDVLRDQEKKYGKINY
ncbi:hypothetical protein Vretimale_3040 [Volvox reticuliferus]|uniref:SnoaL-like domain-containing protein n=1 Tax=Volvox reticuliferus TaxID=1737510 RepID=A0A8J4C9D4_9CHLO|nr:hypothetical protein Vretifemale_6736 [Volvox reticuliferus]GIL97387.1 hypothetical protein Vretimale_3040 [Volvox reticuliferus]